MVVSMRYIPADMLETAAACTSPLKKSHGAPIWIGSPSGLGIENVSEPDFGERVYPNKGDICCFWACGVSAASALQVLKIYSILSQFVFSMQSYRWQQLMLLDVCSCVISQWRKKLQPSWAWSTWIQTRTTFHCVRNRVLKRLIWSRQPVLVTRATEEFNTWFNHKLWGDQQSYIYIECRKTIIL